MRPDELIKALSVAGAADYEISVVRIDDEGEDHDVGGVTEVEYNHETKFIILHVAPIGC